MGTTFRYIADEALEESDLGECQHCERSEVPSYDYDGEIVDPELAANPELAREESEIFAACADCINGGNLRKSEIEIREMTRIVEEHAGGAAALVEACHGIPHIPLMMQNRDWPICCGDWCEFIGNPADYEASVRVPSEYEFWDLRPGTFESGTELKPESLSEVCLFRCLSCPKTYFIWQPT